MPLPSPLPDSPTKWEGWRDYNSDDPYRRLCLSFEGNPGHEQIEENCRQLLIWWQKKLPLKNQPSNPLTQMLRQGIDEAPQYLAEARTILLNPDARRNADERLRARLRENAAAEFYKFLAFALSDGVLKRDDENNLYHLGSAAGLEMDEMKIMVDSELMRRNAVRFVQPAPPPAPMARVSAAASDASFTPSPNASAPPRLEPGSASGDPAEEFMRLLRLSGLSDDDMTDDQRDALCNMGENLGLSGGDAEDLIDDYLEEVNQLPPVSPANAGSIASRLNAAAPVKKSATATPEKKPSAPNRVLESIEVSKFTPLTHEQERQKHPSFKLTLGLEMILINSGTFMMGSTSEGAAPNEQPLSKTNLSCFHISRFPITNAQYEAFDPTHRVRRATWADEHHPVVYVSSLDAIKFCEWLTKREGRRFRLPTESEWEYASRGTDGRSFPWGERLNTGDLANFADCNTTFPWRDAEINDGFAETAPVGSFPRGASPFGIEEMAGNVWEWCLDFYEPYRGKERTNPRSVCTVGRRIYRGGSWKSRASNLRTSARNFNVAEYSANDVGFRVVCECRA